jgi:hypothetical protein
MKFGTGGGVSEPRTREATATKEVRKEHTPLQPQTKAHVSDDVDQDAALDDADAKSDQLEEVEGKHCPGSAGRRGRLGLFQLAFTPSHAPQPVQLLSPLGLGQVGL